MPRPATWIERIPVIQAALEASTADRLDRDEVARLFGVARSRAKTIISVAGGKCGSDGLLTIDRNTLLDYVKFSPEASEYRAHEERRKELHRKLQNAEKEQSLRRVVITEASREEWPKLAALLPKLVFSPGAVTIAHGGFDDLLHTFWLLSQALGNPADCQKFKELVEECKQERLSA